MAGEAHIFGIRHHGPGSARTLERALEALEPDLVLIEGPPEGDALLEFAAGDMEPPVALLVYEAATPANALFYPFAAFSPEWRALRFALERGTPVRFMDLPVAHVLALREAVRAGKEADEGESGEGEAAEEGFGERLRHDPIGELATAAGFSDGERWWECMVEHRRDGSLEVFEAMREAIGELRAEAQPDEENERREAFMRRCIRKALRDGAERVAVVCGAYHAPALHERGSAKADDALLRGLPKVKVEATWVPWTHHRLTMASGYGAGVRSPGWYEHLWTHADAVSERWLTRVARLMRAEDLDASSAHVIESCRLAEALATLRGRSLAGLEELSEATEAVLCEGDATPMALIHERLIVGNRLGRVPEEAPSVPLQRDLESLIRRLRMKQTADTQDLTLDLRKEMHLERSHLLHRLRVLGIDWGEPQHVRGKAGTFHEVWRLQWDPALAVAVVEAGRWGNTVESAASARVADRAAHAESLEELASLIESVLHGDLPTATETLVRAIEDRAAAESDVAHLMDALPPLADVLRYGNVRKSDTDLVGAVVEGLATRICVGMPPACVSLNDQAGQEMASRVRRTHAALSGAAERVDLHAWHAALASVAAAEATAPVVAGTAQRILLDAGAVEAEEAAVALSLALSRAADPGAAAGWIEGFLSGSGLVILHDDRLWGLVDGWLAGLSGEHFNEIVPILRRAFSKFPPAERRMLGEKAREGRGVGSTASTTNRDAGAIDPARAEAAMEVVELILGVRGERR